MPDPAPPTHAMEGPPPFDHVSLVIPVFNERDSLGPLHAEISEVAKTLPMPVEMIFVDDGSNDGSWDVVSKLAATDGRVKGVRFRRNFGKAAALAAGFRSARGGAVVTLDADLQDDPHEIPRFLAAIAGGQDVVSGWKKVRHDPWHKVFPSRVFNALVGKVTGVHLHDHNCGMKGYRGAVTREVRLYGELHRFIPTLAAAKGFTVGELVIKHRARKFGHSKYGWQRFAKGFFDLITVRLLTKYGSRPQHLLGNLALVPAGLGTLGLFALALNAIARAVWGATVGVDPLGQIVGVLFAVGLLLLGSQLFLTGLLAEVVVDRAGEREPYSVSERTPAWEADPG